MEKIDLRSKYKPFYSPSSKEFSFVTLPVLNYLMIDGHGDPSTSQDYQAALQTLYSLSYTLKFAMKKASGIDYTVMGLDGLWWVPDMTKFTMDHKDEWDWTAMILQPEFITSEMVKDAMASASAKGKAPLANRTRLEALAEGECVQIMFFGAYDDEAPTIARMHAFIHENGYTPNGKHHEIYLSDARRVAPEKNKTILRQPVRKM